MATLRDNDLDRLLPVELRRPGDATAGPAPCGDACSAYAQCFALGVDGVVSDDPDTAVKARDAFVAAA